MLKKTFTVFKWRRSSPFSAAWDWFILISVLIITFCVLFSCSSICTFFLFVYITLIFGFINFRFRFESWIFLKFLSREISTRRTKLKFHPGMKNLLIISPEVVFFRLKDKKLKRRLHSLVKMFAKWVYLCEVCNKSTKATITSIACVSCCNWIVCKAIV